MGSHSAVSDPPDVEHAASASDAATIEEAANTRSGSPLRASGLPKGQTLTPQFLAAVRSACPGRPRWSDARVCRHLTSRPLEGH
jgi:hypothetical protein